MFSETKRHVTKSLISEKMDQLLKNLGTVLNGPSIGESWKWRLLRIPERVYSYIFHYMFQDCLRGLMEEEQDWTVEVERVLMLQELTSCWTEELQRYRTSTR